MRAVVETATVCEIFGFLGQLSFCPDVLFQYRLDVQLNLADARTLNFYEFRVDQGLHDIVDDGSDFTRI
jgi:hypothetical protein